MLNKYLYIVPEGSEPTVELVENAIKFNESLVTRYNELEDYYIGQHPIMTRQRVNTLINNKVMVNHCKYITDTNIGYLLGNPVKYTVREGLNIEKIEDEYRKQNISDLDHEIAKDVSIFGRQYEYIYIGENNQVKSAEINVRNCVVAYDDTVEHNKVFAVIYEKGDKNTFTRVTVLTDKEEISFSTVDGRLAKGKAEAHKLDQVPIVEYRNNDEYMGDFEQVLSLVDAYNILQSDRINDKEQVVNAITVFKNIELTPEQRELMKVTRAISIPLDSEIEMLVRSLDEGQLDILRKIISEDIHKISQTPNLSDENFVGNASGVAIRYKLLAFEQNIKNKERSFEKGLMERFSIYNEYLNKLKSVAIIPTYEVDAVFTRNLPQNDYETSQMIVNLSGMNIPMETLINQLSFITNGKEAMKQARRELKDLVKQDVDEAYGTLKPNSKEEEPEENPEEVEKE